MKIKFKELKKIIKEEIQKIILEDNDPCWDGYKMVGMKEKNDKEVPNCIPESESLDNEEEVYLNDAVYDDGTQVEENFEFYESLDENDQILESEYQGRKVTLNKPMRGDVKKFKVYVKDPQTGNVKKVNFGDPNMRIKKSNPERRKSFRARHRCENPGPKTKARYWSCKKW